jgi:predicted rRNA methylase YqxC with S4 and FtsJ domains
MRLLTLQNCCLFQVFGIDVGYGQLADKIRNDPRIVVMERFNLRYLKPEDLDGIKVINYCVWRF